MPYTSNAQLPAAIQGLPAHAKTIWRKAFNASLARGLSENRARRIAWSAVKQSYKKVGDEWVRKSTAESNIRTRKMTLREALPIPAAVDESGVAHDCTFIQAGLNKTRRRFYTPEFLRGNVERFDKSFCYADHPSRSDERDQPERHIRSVAAVTENARWDEVQQAVVGDVRFLDNETGRDIRATFANETVRARAGHSIYLLGDVRVERKKVKESGGWVDFPVTIASEGQFDVDFVTAPTAGGRVSEIREGGTEMPEWEDLTLEELQDQRPDLVKALASEPASAKKAEEPEEVVEPEEKPEDVAAIAAESDRDTDITKRLDAVEARERRADAREVVTAQLAESKLTDKGQVILRKRFAEVEAPDAAEFTKLVESAVAEMQELEKDLRSAGRGRGITVEDTPEDFSAKKRIAEASGFEDKDKDNDKEGDK